MLCRSDPNLARSSDRDTGMAENLLDGADGRLSRGLAVHALPGAQRHHCAHVHIARKGFLTIGSMSKRYL